MARFSFRNFLNHTFDRWIRRHLTRAGHLTLITMTCALVVGINTQANLTYQLLVLLFLFLLTGMLFSIRRPGKVEIKRDLPRYATAGERFQYTLRFQNLTQRLLNGLLILDELKPQKVRDFIGDQAAKAYRRKRRKSAGDDFNWFKQVKTHPVDMPPLAPNGAGELKLELTPQRRGFLNFQGFALLRPDPLGLFNAVHLMKGEASLLVLPRRYNVRMPPEQGSRLYQPGGITYANALGGAEEFVALRDYLPGDSMRDVHWKSWAKVGKLMIKQHQPEYFIRQTLLLDTFVEPGEEARFEEAVSVASSFVADMDISQKLLDLLFVESEVYQFTTGHGIGDATPMLEILACVGPAVEASFELFARAVMDNAAAMSAVIAVFVKWDDHRANLINALRGRHIPVTVYCVMDKAPKKPPGVYHPLVMGQIQQDLAAGWS